MTYCTNNISLQDAMTMDLSHSRRAWCVSGNHISDDLCDNMGTTETTVFKHPDGTLEIALSFNLAANCGQHFASVAKFVSLTSLKKQFPELFLLTGNLRASDSKKS